MCGVANKDWVEARRYAEIALNAAKCMPANDMWAVATIAEAHLYLGNKDKAIEHYKRLPALTAESWKLTSSGQQAYNAAIALEERDLAEEIDALFSPGGGKIFISYSHKNRDWLELFRKQLAPYLQDTDARLAIWDDTKIDAGEVWLSQIQQELEHCRVAILLVSDDFLNSDFIMKRELPVLIQRASSGRIRLYWFLVTPCAWDATKLRELQSAYPSDSSIEELQPQAAQRRALYEIARKIAKEAHRPRVGMATE
jgi:hypothetical protein